MKRGGVNKGRAFLPGASQRRSDERVHESALNRALILGSNTVFYNDPNLIYTVMKKYDAVTKADIQRVAKKYFQPDSRTVVITLSHR